MGSTPVLDRLQIERMEGHLAADGLVVFPTDTVYGVGCDPESLPAIERLYRLKGRPPARPAAVMFFDLDLALSELPELTPREQIAVSALLPGPLTILLPNRLRRFPLACGPDGAAVLGLRVPLLDGPLTALGSLGRPVMQSSANLSGEPEARRLGDVPQSLREGADMLLDGGQLPGIASTVVDLGAYEDRGTWRIVRAGALGRADVDRVLANC